MDISRTDLATAFDLLRTYSTLGAVSSYLERRLLPSSANSWSALYERKLLPALQDGKLNRSDLVKMIREAEEYGRQHVFLYQCSQKEAMDLMNPESLVANLAKMGLSELKEKPRLVKDVNGLQLVDVRIDQPKRGDRSLVIKAVDVRSYKTQIDKRVEGNREFVTYEVEQERAVNLISVREDGLTEVRIQSYRNALDYPRAVEDLFAKATGIIERMQFAPISLTRARLRLVTDRKKYAHLVRFADTELRDKEGRVLSLATSFAQQELYADGSASDKGIAGFLSVGKPTCDEVDCFWVKRANSNLPTTELHTLIGGQNNEFVLTAQCSRTDYQYALAQILSLTR